jgi:hypothetical protein
MNLYLLSEAHYSHSGHCACQLRIGLFPWYVWHVSVHRHLITVSGGTQTLRFGGQLALRGAGSLLPR